VHHLRDTIRQFLHRRRRFVAACCAALAVVLVCGSRAQSGPAESLTRDIRPGENVIPAQVSGAASLRVGDVLDLASATDDAPAHVVAHAARVLELPADSGWAGSSGSTIVIAVAEGDALSVITASAAGQLIPIVHGS